MVLRPLFIILICTTLIKDFKAEDAGENLENEEDLFVPTHEWQVVKQGQKIPKGLHVRINLDTGITEAKLVEDGNDPMDETVSILSEPKKDSFLTKSQEELHKFLTHIDKDEDFDEEQEKIRAKFKSYEELKKDLSEINIRPRTDNEVLIELMQRHKDALKTDLDEELILTILHDLEYLVHQIDNANDFVKLNGFQNIIYVHLNSSSTKIKETSLKLLGSCMQNNAKVQIHGLETGAIGILLKAVVLNTDYDLKNVALFALGCLLRHFPLAQSRFVENAGVNVLGDLIEKNSDLKIRVKIITLVNDLLVEHEEALLDLQDANSAEKVQQYNRINLKSKLQNYNWCSHVGKLLIDVVTIDINDHDLIEKSLNALVALQECTVKDASVLIENLIRLKVQYTNLSVETNEDEYFEHLLSLCNKALSLLKYTVKSEL